jgi:hypothetical protein
MSDLANIEHLETDLWDAADNLRANSKLTAGEYYMPVLGVTFQLFNQPVANGGAMAGGGGGVTWNNNLAVNGTIPVASTTLPIPVLKNISLNRTNLVLSGTNGYASGRFYVLSTTNLNLPRSNWTRVSTNIFDGSGNFNVTNVTTPGTPLNFYTIQLQ